MNGESDTTVRHEVRPGEYLDSIVLMQIQRSLADAPGVRKAAAVMATEANRELLRESGLWVDAMEGSRGDDLVLAVRAASSDEAERALAEVDELMRRSRSGDDGGAEDYRYKSLETALADRPDARWVLVSVPGKWAAGVAEEALRADRNVFLYSDNVSVEDEVRLKDEAARRGRLVLGPDCGTARIAGVGLGFGNRVRSGGIGIVAASGTGLQSLMVEVHRQGSGVSQAIGVGGRDLSPEVGGRATRAALALLARDPDTRVLVLVSKPPSAAVAARILGLARSLGKPTVVCFQGLSSSVRALGRVRIATGLAEAARMAVELEPGGERRGADAARSEGARSAETGPDTARRTSVRGLFAGGTLAQEIQLALRTVLDPLRSNAAVPGVERAVDPAGPSEGHTILDLGADELTVGRPHPMLDPELRAERLRVELRDAEVAAVVVDVVLGDGSHADPAGSIVDAVAELRDEGVDLPRVFAWVVGTELDPQGLADQVRRLREVGVLVHRGLDGLVAELVEGLPADPPAEGVPVDASAVAEPFEAINVGVDAFASAIEEQEGRVARVEWRPPAGGDDRLAGILARMKKRTST